MDDDRAILAFAALSQPTRLDSLRLLVAHQPEGMPAGDIARSLAIPHNTLSTHLAVLVRSGLVEAERRSRSIVYRARMGALSELASYLIDDCCAGQPELCRPAAENSHSSGDHL